MRSWERFLSPPLDLHILGAMRIGYAALLLVNLLVLAPNVELYFGETGLLPYETSRRVLDPDGWGLFDWLPHTNGVAWVAYGGLVAAAVSLLSGFRSRTSALVVFLLFTSFQHRNTIIFDAEDTVFRLFALFFALAPAGRALSVDALQARAAGVTLAPPATWSICGWNGRGGRPWLWRRFSTWQWSTP